jgi:hypothetical protein
LLKAVIDAGADLTRRDKSNGTPLDVARTVKRERSREQLVAMMA